ncbi:MAG: tRNA (N(6)-L-threonylcarbamoyladenosine(37)-C(2))-methylthiotransferase MtaB [Ruminococcus sp.]|nr:tRNA (N(6)-L-threonylcarbamoyladenosine(37)-C(2))-methylthiotransferase MtaB [Ruminococcus sp.]
MRCYFYTFGCKVNTCETAGMQQLLRDKGFLITDDPEDADIAIINSCTVTASGDHRMLTLLRQLRKKHPSLIIVLTGCYVQAFPEEAGQIDEYDILIGNKDKARLPELIRRFLEKPSYIHEICAVSPYEKDAPFEPLPCDAFARNTRAFLKIQDGCNCFCTYCIIPYARGRCRSMPLDDLKKQVRQLTASGHREIVLCGINLAFYGNEWGGTLLDAVKAAAEEGAERVRLGSLEPERMTDALLEGLSEIPGFCPQFHLSLQSGCTGTLRAMNRRYTAEEYADLCRRVRQYFPECAITTDIMVGFPGETEEDFQESLAFAEKIRFAKMHVFRYSPRPGTPAAKMEEQIPERIKTERMQRMQMLAARMQTEHLKSLIGRKVPVLFEREKGDGFHIGHAPDGSVIKIPQKNRKKSLRKSVFYVRIEENDAVCCFGQLTEEACKSNIKE